MDLCVLIQNWCSDVPNAVNWSQTELTDNQLEKKKGGGGKNM